MSIHDAYDALRELSEGRRPDSKRALNGLQALIRLAVRHSADANLQLAADSLQHFVVHGDVNKVRLDPALPQMLEAVKSFE